MFHNRDATLARSDAPNDLKKKIVTQGYQRNMYANARHALR
jgi:hypothetical protein